MKTKNLIKDKVNRERIYTLWRDNRNKGWIDVAVEETGISKSYVYKMLDQEVERQTLLREIIHALNKGEKIGEIIDQRLIKDY